MSTRELDIDALKLESGSHSKEDRAFCIMEAVAYIAGEPWTDHPSCVCPVLAAFLRNWNDSLGDVDRQRLKPLIRRVAGTNDGNSGRRGWMCLDWLSREYAPAFLDLRHGSTRGNFDAEYTRCPHCDRATVLIEHEWTPQLHLMSEEDREAIYFTCQWCNGEIEAAAIAPKTPRKPATSAGWEDETEWARRTRTLPSGARPFGLLRAILYIADFCEYLPKFIRIDRAEFVKRRSCAVINDGSHWGRPPKAICLS